MLPVHAQARRQPNVRPHPHIGLATITYLFDGVILHPNSRGSEQRIAPSAINGMTAGRGIVHPGAACITTLKGARSILVGGNPLDGHRWIWWNLASSRNKSVQQASSDW